jgi:protein TonB
LFNRMSPGAVLSSALLHATLVAAFLPMVPQIDRHLPGRAIEFTVDLPTAPPAALPRPPTLEQVLPPVEPAPPLSASDLASLAPPPPQPTLEQILPPLEAPPPPLAAPELAAIAPPPAPKPAEPKPALAKPAVPAPKPASQAPLRQPVAAAAAAREHGPNLSHGTVRAAPAQPPSAVSDERRREAREDYLREVIRRLSQFRFSRSAGETSEQGLVVARLTVARDGRLLEAMLVRSSGFPDLDSGVMETIRRAAPFAPLPPDIAPERYTFILPVNYVHDR